MILYVLRMRVDDPVAASLLPASKGRGSNEWGRGAQQIEQLLGEALSELPPGRGRRVKAGDSSLENAGFMIRDLVFDLIEAARDDYPSSYCNP